MSTILLLGQPPAPTAIHWDGEPVYDGREPARPVRECCRQQSTHECKALGAIRATLFLYGVNNALTITDLIDLLPEEWNERFKGFWPVAADRRMMSVWCLLGLLHAEPGTFTLGRLSRSGEFILITDDDELGKLYALDDFRGER